MQNDPTERLPDVTRPPGCFHAHPGLQVVPKVPSLSLECPLLPIPRPAIRTITEPFGLHQDPPPRLVPKEHTLNLFQAFAAWIQGQFREVIDHSISVDHPLRNGKLNQFSRSTSWKADATPTTRVQKPSSVNIEFMDIDSDSDETSNPELVLLEESANAIERLLVLARDAGNGYFYRRNRLSLGNSSGPPLLLWNMEPQGSKTPYQHEGTVESALYTEARECSNIHAIRNKPSGHAQQTDSANRMVYISGDILDTELAPWATRRRPVCIFPEQETRPLLQLVSVKQSARTERSDHRMVQVQQSVLLPTLEPDSTGSPEGPPRESHNNTITASSSNNSGPRSEKLKVAALGKQKLELDGLEYQRRFLETQGFGTYAIDFIVPNERRVRCRSRPVMDISPIIKLLREWGQNSTITIKQITAKLYWLLSVTGFLRGSDIHRIDDQRSHIDKGVLNLVIVVPKEKRGGRPIEKTCQINLHTDIILCPVNAYMLYKEKIAVNLCPAPHANNSNWVVNRLIRYVNLPQNLYQ
ncbi:hypothetical protein AYI69_g7741 [Smittium culicis]|uniref:Uncharacterized protein n=1 Tax=Smittium culicis TaxID=133412 RepID=A0A1R1XPW3_9FUNG|nr:hypothetical protein AYI69_g7741 [Smittium culicis]